MIKNRSLMEWDYKIGIQAQKNLVYSIKMKKKTYLMNKICQYWITYIIQVILFRITMTKHQIQIKIHIYKDKINLNCLQ